MLCAADSALTGWNRITELLDRDRLLSTAIDLISIAPKVCG